MSDLLKMIQISNLLKHCEWTDDELLNLPEKYIDIFVHIALEKADKDLDEKNFKKILNGNGKYRKTLLLKHIEFTTGVFDWNYKNNLN